MKKFDNATYLPPGQLEVERRERDKRPEHVVVVAVGVWLLFAAILGALVFLIILVGWTLTPYRVNFAAAALVALIVVTVAFVGLFGRKGIPMTEVLLDMDINGDGRVGAPAQPGPPQVHKFEYRSDDGRRGQFFDLPEGVTLDEIVMFARGFLRRRTSVSHWPGKRRQLEAVRTMLMDAELAEWVNVDNPNQGWLLNRRGMDFCGQVLNESRPSPTGGSTHA